MEAIMVECYYLFRRYCRWLDYLLCFFYDIMNRWPICQSKILKVPPQKAEEAMDGGG